MRLSGAPVSKDAFCHWSVVSWRCLPEDERAIPRMRPQPRAAVGDDDGAFVAVLLPQLILGRTARAATQGSQLSFED